MFTSAKNTAEDYKFRIVLKFSNNKVQNHSFRFPLFFFSSQTETHYLFLLNAQDNYVIAVSDRLDKIHTDWNWIEKHLFSQIASKEGEKAIDEFLFETFEMKSQSQKNGKRKKIIKHS